MSHDVRCDRSHQGRIRGSFSWGFAADPGWWSALHFVWHQSRYSHCDIQQIRTAGATHQLFRKSAADFIVRRSQSCGGDATMVTASDRFEPNSPFRHYRARQYAQRKRTDDTLAQFHSPPYVHARLVLLEHLAFPKAIYLSTAFRSYCDV